MKSFEKSNINSWIKSKRHLIYATILAALLAFRPLSAKSSTVIDKTRDTIEQVISPNFTDNILQRTWVKIPDWYEEKIRNLVDQDDLLKDGEIAKYTEDFIVERVNKNPWISDENRCLFVINLCLEYLSGKDVYPWEDGNEERTQEFLKVTDNLRDILDKYINEITHRVVTLVYMRLNSLVDFYDYYKGNPGRVSQEEVNSSRQLLDKLISLCNLFGIDYRKKLSPAKEFYWIYDKIYEEVYDEIYNEN